MSRRHRVALAAAVLAVVMGAACGGSDGPTAAPPTTTSPPASGAGPTTAPARGPDLAAVRLKLTKVGTFDQPLAMAWCRGVDQPLVAEKTGRVRTLSGDTVLDLSPAVTTGSEQGLLGVTCSPEGTTLFASYTDVEGDSRVDAFPLADHVDRDAGRTILAVDQPAANHNGGNIAFGPDGKLWFGLGDGGGAGDRYGNAQEQGQVLGSIMTIDPAGEAEPDIMVKGVRNPWRWSFDRATGDLWIGDVGQDHIEEVDHLRADRIRGANLGWPAFEGRDRFRKDVAVPTGAIAPVFQYTHDEGRSIAGGYVYRGTEIPALAGAYLFADTYQGRVRAIVVDGDRTVAHRDLGAVPGGLVSSFAEGPAAELYVLSLDGGVYRLDPR